MIISPGYFRTLRIPLIAGREFSIQDHAKSEAVAIVNESFARRYWPADPLPLGRRVQIGGEKSAWLTVVGIARDVRHVSISDPPRPEVYRPHSQAPERTMMLVARSRTAGRSTAADERTRDDSIDRWPRRCNGLPQAPPRARAYGRRAPDARSLG